MYTFYATKNNGDYYEICGLTKRQAVIRFNKATREIGYTLKECGWSIED